MSTQDVPQSEAFQAVVWQKDPASVTVVLSGELDLATAPRLRDCLAKVAAGGAIHIEFDAADLAFIDSTGIGVLVQELERVTHAGGSLAVTNAGAQAMKIFAITGLLELLSVSGTETSPAKGRDELSSTAP